MLKRYAVETNSKVKDRMMLIIKIKRDGMGIVFGLKIRTKSLSPLKF